MRNLLIYFGVLFFVSPKTDAQQFYKMVPPSGRFIIKKDILSSNLPSTATTSEEDLVEARLLAERGEWRYHHRETTRKFTNTALNTTSNIITSYIPHPALKAAFSAMMNFGIQDWNENTKNYNKHDFNKVLERSFSQYSSNYLKRNPKASFSDVSGHFAKFVRSDIVKDQDYNIIGRNIDAFVLTYIQQEESRFDKLFDKAYRRRNRHGEDQVNNIGSTLNRNLKSQFADIEAKQVVELTETQQSYEKFQDAVLQQFDKVYNEIGSMQNEIKTHSKQIKTNTEEIKKLNEKVNLTDAELGNLKNLQQENRSLIADNAYKINVMADVLYGNVDTKSQMYLIQTDVVKVQDSAKEMQRLQTISFLETADRYAKIANEGVVLATNLGLSDKDAERANKLITAVSTATQLYMAYQKGDLLSGMQAVNTAFRVFGGKKPKPDPMFTAMMKQFELINQRLDVMDKKLDYISQRLDTLISLEIQLHEQTTQQIAELNNKVIDLNKKVDYIIQLISSKCNIMGSNTINAAFFANLQEKNKKVTSLEELNNQYFSITKLPDVLDCLHQTTISQSVSDKPFLLYTTFDPGSQVQINYYEPLLSAFSYYRQKQPDYATAVLPSLIYLPNETDQSSDVYKAIMEQRDSNDYAGSESIVNVQEFKSLLHPAAVNQVAKLLFTLEPYLYFGKSGQHFQPFTVQNFQNLHLDDINQGFIDRLKNVLAFCNTAIAQQNILSGGPLFPLYYQYVVENTRIPPIITDNLNKSLEVDNYFLKANLSTYILHSFLGNNRIAFNKFQELFYATNETPPSHELLSTVNNLIGIQSISLEVQKQGNIYKLALQIHTPNSGNTFLLPVQIPDIIASNTMIYDPEVYELNSTKAAVISKLIEYEYMNEIRDKHNIQDLLNDSFVAQEFNQTN